MFRRRPAGLSRTVFGIKFPTPVGIAAGLDKDAEAFDALGALGFSFVEIGTVPLPQPGNPSPRLFRLVADHSLINRMGFNNQGAARAAERLRKRRTDVIVGGNIGKNKVTPNDQAVSDYVKSFETLFPYVDYFAVNVSSQYARPARSSTARAAHRDPFPAAELQCGARKAQTHPAQDRS